VNTIEEIQDALAAIVDGAETEGRDLSDEELGQIEAHEAELATAQARRERTVAARERIQAGRQVATPALITRREQASDTIDVAFTAYLRTGQANADIAELRNAQSEGTPSEGGYLVPEGFRQKLVDKMKAFGGVAQEAEELVTATGQQPAVADPGRHRQHRRGRGRGRHLLRRRRPGVRRGQPGRVLLHGGWHGRCAAAGVARARAGHRV
jgi:HK97 family phage major capsid protein